MFVMVLILMSVNLVGEVIKEPSVNPLQTNRRLLYLSPSPYRAVITLSLGYKTQSAYAVSGTSRCLFSDKYKTHKYSVGRAYSC